MTVAEVLPLIDEVCDGLSYMSETDFPVTSVSAPRALKGNFTPENVVRAFGWPPLSQIGERSYPDTIAVQSNHDPNWILLDDVLSSHLDDVRLFAVLAGTPGYATHRLLFIGLCDGNMIAGATTMTVET